MPYSDQILSFLAANPLLMMEGYSLYCFQHQNGEYKCRSDVFTETKQYDWPSLNLNIYVKTGHDFLLANSLLLSQKSENVPSFTDDTFTLSEVFELAVASRMTIARHAKQDLKVVVADFGMPGFLIVAVKETTQNISVVSRRMLGFSQNSMIFDLIPFEGESYSDIRRQTVNQAEIIEAERAKFAQSKSLVKVIVQELRHHKVSLVEQLQEHKKMIQAMMQHQDLGVSFKTLSRAPLIKRTSEVKRNLPIYSVNQPPVNNAVANECGLQDSSDDDEDIDEGPRQLLIRKLRPRSNVALLNLVKCSSTKLSNKIIIRQDSSTEYKSWQAQQCMEWTDVIIAQTKMAITLLDDVLNANEKENNLFIHQKVDFSMLDVLTTSFAVVRSFAQSKQICLEMVAEKQTQLMVQQMYGDPNRMTLVLINFLASSIKRSQPNGKIIVKLQVVKNYGSGMEIGALLNAFEISIEDFGPGIPQYQLDSPEQENTESMGLGLTICRMIVEQMGGSIKVKSELGVGATFLINFDESIFKGASLNDYERNSGLLKTPLL